MAKLPFLTTNNTVNDLRSNVNGLNDRVGDLALLTTAADSDLVSAINSLGVQYARLDSSHFDNLSANNITLSNVDADSSSFRYLSVVDMDADSARIIDLSSVNFDADSARSTNLSSVNLLSVNFDADSAKLSTISVSTLNHVSSYNGYVPANQTITLTAGTGLIGGGNLSSNRTFTVDFADSAEAIAGTATGLVMSPATTKIALATIDDPVAIALLIG